MLSGLMRTRLLFGLTFMLIATGRAAVAQQTDIGIAPVSLDRESYAFDTAEQHGIRVDVVTRGLPHPFSLAFLPSGDALVTIRGRELRLIRGATGDAARLEPTPISGTPPAADVRGAGLHEVAVHPDFADNRLVYYTFNRPVAPAADVAPGERPPTALVVARARLDGLRLTGIEELLAGEGRAGGSGSRLAFGADGMLYVTTGAPFSALAQDPASIYGKVLRIRDDGRIPKDNPFVATAGARPEVYTLGHRDQLGLTVQPGTNVVLAAEHGPNGGDEVNMILPGRNYGWPEFSFGRTYEGPRHSVVPLGPDTEQPLVLWIPSIAPTGMTFYSGARIAAWTGNLFVGSARQGEIPGTGGLERVVFNDDLGELRRESLLGQLHQRIRDVREGPDGLLYVITDEDDGALLRISPDRFAD
jgi:glucose/arabinose dehydrogenase